VIGALLRAGGLAVALARGRVRAEARHVARRTVVAVARVVLMLLAFGFGLAAFTVWLTRQIGTVPALGSIGLGFLLAAGIVVLVAKATDPKRLRALRPRPITDTVKQALAAPVGQAPSPLDAAGAPTDSKVGSTAGAMLVVGLVGYLLARQLSGRKES
jgi:hypothetical protein